MHPSHRAAIRSSAGSPPPRKRLGQHFLTDPRLLGRIADAALLQPGDTVVEIGPGRGALTEELRSRAGRVIAVELDHALVELLHQRFAGDPRVSIVEADVLDVDVAALAGGPFVLVGNLPYFITTPILFAALARPRAQRAVFLVQREVAGRMSAAPGSKIYGALSVNLQALARVETLFPVSAGAFHPVPSVDSAVVRLTPLAEPILPADREEAFGTFVRACFALRRKQMRRVLRTVSGVNAVRAATLLYRVGVDPEARPEQLEVARMVALFEEVHRDQAAAVPVRRRRRRGQ